mmetsp:Transcript_123435/g.360452  ORF Transcript_123435/g.360452 Transcript_123435/m.360452 type:complete len:423 (+) Transcript_123435:799-2067(+)
MTSIQMGPTDHNAHVGALGLVCDGDAQLLAAKIDANDWRDIVVLWHVRLVGAGVVVPLGLAAGVYGPRAQQRNGLVLVRRQRQQALVLQQGHGGAGSSPRHVEVLRRSRVPGQLLCTIWRRAAKLAFLKLHVPDSREDPNCCVPHPNHLMVRERDPGLLADLQVEAPLVGGLVSEHVLRCTWGRHHHAVETHDVLQVSLKELLVTASPKAVDLMVSTHDTCSTTVHRGLKRRVEHVPRGEVSRGVVKVNRTLLNTPKVLRNCHDAISLSSQDPMPRHDTPKSRILAREGVKVFIVHCGTVHADGGPKHRIGAQRLELLCHSQGDFSDHVWVPGGRQREVRWEGGDTRSLLRIAGLPAGDGVVHLHGGDAIVWEGHGLAGVVAVGRARVCVQEAVEGLVGQLLGEKAAMRMSIDPLVRPILRL